MIILPEISLQHGHRATIKFDNCYPNAPVLKITQRQKYYSHLHSYPTKTTLHIFADGSAHCMRNEEGISNGVLLYKKGSFSKFLKIAKYIGSDKYDLREYMSGINVAMSKLKAKRVNLTGTRRAKEFKLPAKKASVKFMIGTKENSPILKIEQNKWYTRLLENPNYPRLLHINPDGSGKSIITDAWFERTIVYKKGEFSEILKKFNSNPKRLENLYILLDEINERAISSAANAVINKGANTYIKQIKELPPGTFGEVIILQSAKMCEKLLKNAKRWMKI